MPTSGEPTDTGFLRLLHDLGVPPSALGELAQHLYKLCILRDAEVGPHLQSQIADLFRGSWFRLETDSVTMLTARGSRPGDPLADVLFAFTFGAYVRAVKQALQRYGLSTPVPHVAQSAPWHTWEPVQELGLPAWADDFTHLQVAVTSEDLLDRVVRSTELLVRQATCLGMILTFAVDKTATLLTSNCIRQGSRHVFQDDQGSDVLKVRDT